MSSAALPKRLRLTLYGRSYCHLCEDMLAALDAIAPGMDLDIDVVDVDQDPVLEERYGELVPVLAHGEARICHYFLDRQALTAYLAAFR